MFLDKFALVVGIGLLMYPVLKEVNPRLAVWYPGFRIAECLVSAACGVYLLARSEVVPHHLLWVYVPTGLGGIVLRRGFLRRERKGIRSAGFHLRHLYSRICQSSVLLRSGICRNEEAESSRCRD